MEKDKAHYVGPLDWPALRAAAFATQIDVVDNSVDGLGVEMTAPDGVTQTYLFTDLGTPQSRSEEG